MPPLGRLTNSKGANSKYLLNTQAPTDYTDHSLGGVLLRARSGLVNFGKEAVVDPVLRGGQALTKIQANLHYHKNPLEGVNVGQLASDTLQTGLNVVPGDKVAELAGGLATKLVPALAAAKTAKAAAPGVSALEGAMTAAAKTSRAAKATQAGNSILASQYGTISKPVARATDLVGTVGKLADVGITKPQDAERVASGITGANGLLTKAVTKAAGGAGTVKTDGLRGVVTDAIENHGLVDSEAKSVMSVVKGQLNKLAGGPNPRITGDANPSDALGVMKSLEARIADLRGKGSNYKLTDPKRLDQASVLQALHNEIQDRLYTAAGANKNLSKVLTPELRNSLVALHPASPQWAKYVDGTIMQSKDVGSLRSVAAPFVNISKVIHEASINAPTFGGKVANDKGGIVKAAINATVNSGPVKRTAAKVLRGNGVGPVGAKVAGVTAGLGRIVGPTATAVGKVPVGVDLAALSSLSNGDAGTKPSQPTPSPTDAALTASDLGASTPDTTSSADGAFSPAVLQALALHDIQTTGGKNLDKIATLQKLFGSSATSKPLSSANNELLGNANSGLDAISQLRKELSNNPNEAKLNAGASLLGGFGRGIAGTAGYDAARSELTDILARLRTGAAITKTEEAQYKAMLPTAFDPPNVVAQKLDRYQKLFEGVAGRVQPGDTSALDALTSGR